MKFWINDIHILYNNTDVIPTNEMSLIEQMNALTRMCILLFLLFYILHMPTKYMHFIFYIFVCIIVSYFIFNKNINEHYDNVNKYLDFDTLNSKINIERLTDNNIINDQQKFENACYNLPPTCKINQKYCLNYNEYRI